MKEGAEYYVKRIILLVVMVALMVALAATAAFAQLQGPVTATGVLEGPVEDNSPDPTPTYRLTDEATGTTYVLMSGFVDLAPFAGQRVTITGSPIGGADFAPPALNVTTIEPAGDESPDTTAQREITGTEASEVLYGTYGNDLIFGLEGDDLLVGEAGTDSVIGGPGNDFLVAGYAYFQVAPNAPASSDYVEGGPGNDLIDSADLAGSPDNVNCGPGIDVVYAGVEDSVAAGNVTEATECEFVYRYYGY